MNGESLNQQRARLAKQVVLVVVGPLHLDDIEQVQEMARAAFGTLGIPDVNLIARAALPEGPICFVVTAEAK